MDYDMIASAWLMRTFSLLGGQTLYLHLSVKYSLLFTLRAFIFKNEE